MRLTDLEVTHLLSHIHPHLMMGSITFPDCNRKVRRRDFIRKASRFCITRLKASDLLSC